MSWKPAKAPSRTERWMPSWVPGWLKQLVRRCVKWGLVMLVIVAAVCLFYFYLSWKYDMSKVAAMPERSVIEDRHGIEFATIHGEKRRLITRSEIPDVMVKALLAREDARFFEHKGVDVKGLLRATLRNIKDRSFTQGASTLSMQLTRNSYQLRAKSIHRKLLEIAVTLRIESNYSKDEILSHYLNRIYFGSGCHGIEEAAQTYFGMSTSQLNTGECALLVGIIRGPHLFSPFRNIKGALLQRDEVLERMRTCGYLNEDQFLAARSEPIRLVSEDDRHKGSSYVRETIRKQLNVILARHDIRGGGLRIKTTLDAALQQQYEAKLARPIKPLEGGQTGTLQSALVSIDPSTGGILAMCGGRDYGASPFNRAYLARRDLGAAFHPFLMAMAVERNKLAIKGQPLQTGRQLGVEETIRLSKRFGFSGPFAKTEDLYRGTIAASPIELASAAGALAADGQLADSYLISQVMDADGAVLYQREPSLSGVISKDAAADGLTFMRKTSTPTFAITSSRRDAWAISYPNKQRLTVLWLGYDQPKKIGPVRDIKKAMLSVL